LRYLLVPTMHRNVGVSSCANAPCPYHVRGPNRAPQPPPPKPWSEEAPEVTHVTASKKFKKLLAKKDHVLTFFYAPWCGHCKAAKPEYLDAAKEFVGDEQREFVAVDCTAGAGAQALCGRYEVTGYPTIKYFAKGKLAFDYAGGRKKDDFIEFMTDPKPPPPPVS